MLLDEKEPDVLIRIGLAKATYFCSPNGTPFADVPIDR